MIRTPPIGRHLRGRGLVVVIGLILVQGARSEAAEKPAVVTAADTVIALETARGQALLTADTTALSRMTAVEFIEINRFGGLRTKADNIREVGSGDLKLTAVKYDSLSVRFYGDVALLRGVADNAGTFHGFPFAGRLRYTRIFVRREGRWQAVAMQHTLMP